MEHMIMRSTSNNSQFDEGYSEETRSQSDSDMQYVPDNDLTSPSGRVMDVVKAAVGHFPAAERMRKSHLQLHFIYFLCTCVTYSAKHAFLNFTFTSSILTSAHPANSIH
jgi:hypothetical protein